VDRGSISSVIKGRVHLRFKGLLHGAFSMCVSMSDKPFDAEACDIGGQASATNGLSDMKTHIENAPCNRPLTLRIDLPFDLRFGACVGVGDKAFLLHCHVNVGTKSQVKTQLGTKGRVHLRHDLRFDLRFRACVGV
jgi:hypothetical protein